MAKPFSGSASARARPSTFCRHVICKLDGVEEDLAAESKGGQVGRHRENLFGSTTSRSLEPVGKVGNFLAAGTGSVAGVLQRSIKLSSELAGFLDPAHGLADAGREPCEDRSSAKRGESLAEPAKRSLCLIHALLELGGVQSEVDAQRTDHSGHDLPLSLGHDGFEDGDLFVWRLPTGRCRHLGTQKRFQLRHPLRLVVGVSIELGCVPGERKSLISLTRLPLSCPGYVQR
jgi:hypothetical protein